MDVEYKFLNGESVHIEVYGEIEKIILELDRELKNNNRKETRRHKSFSLSDKNIENMSAATDICNGVLKNIDKETLFKAISKLKPDEQKLLHNLYLSGRPITQKEYASILGITENAVQLRLAKLKRKLKHILSTNF